jgi:hypothetical protein
MTRRAHPLSPILAPTTRKTISPERKTDLIPHQKGLGQRTSILDAKHDVSQENDTSSKGDPKQRNSQIEA